MIDTYLMWLSLICVAAVAGFFAGRQIERAKWGGHMRTGRLVECTITRHAPGFYREEFTCRQK